MGIYDVNVAPGLAPVEPQVFYAPQGPFGIVPSPNTLRAPVWTRILSPPTPPQDFPFPNVVLQAFAQLQVYPVGAALDETVPRTDPRQLDFQFPNLPLFNAAQAVQLPPGQALDETVPRSDPRQLDFQFRNVALENFAQLQVKPVGAELDETVPRVDPHQVDFQFPNVALQAFAQLQVHPVGAALEETVPRKDPHQTDFQFTNIVLEAFAQLQIKPVGAALVESVPRQDPRQQDFQFTNMSVLATPARMPFFNPDFPAPPAALRQLDFAFPNLAPNAPVSYPVTAFWGPIPQPAPHQVDITPPNLAILAAPVVNPPVQELDETVPSPRALPVDFQFPNITLALTIPPPDQSGRKPHWTHQPPPPTPVDFPFPNIALPATPVTVTKPAAQQVGIDRPAAQPNPVDFQFLNLVLGTNLFALREPLSSRPAPIAPSTDLLFPNLLTTTLTPVVQKPVGAIIVESTPRQDPRQLDFQFTNVAALNFAQLQVKPVGGAAGLFDRPISVSIPIDGPIPNLLTTTLSVVQRPLVNFSLLFDRKPTPAPSQDQTPTNLLPTLLTTPPGTPIFTNQYYFLLTDRPAPTAPSWDQAQPNNTIFIPPPPPPTGLHQNPVFISMGKLMYLGNLPS